MSRKKLITNVVRYVLYALMVLFFIWALQHHYLASIFTESDKFFVMLKQHLKLVVVSSFLAIIIAVPAGIIVTRKSFKKAEWLVSNVANLGQTIPSIAVLALMMGVLGLGFKTAIFALFIYSLLPIYRNTVAGINSVNDKLIDAAKGMGFKPYQILFRIELPNAAYSIIAGARTAIVLNIGTAALAFLIGGGGFGTWIFTGISLFNNDLLLSGAVPVILLAIMADYLLRLLEYLLVPKGVRRSAKTS
ncbi:osmoprotectant transport system permease protein [Scopulibacillus darangshiensis]|uniref:Osmoprotectant transport system permease protein n=1 Tax=Scopulibacillus darangshiensis TaxID=442528 RepID=A0A4R2P4B5_9BACL|nr:ABC transporter permease [Scopulibacillus darangshiensis]TCP29487.1 osmoprotectant transport system permease protein [Scopulibacillus darangshiensis]